MKVNYPAVFKPNVKEGNCHICFPDLEHECDVPYGTPEKLKRSAAEELGFALWMCEDAWNRIPAPRTVGIKELPNGAYISDVAIDYGEFKESVAVKVIDLSE